MTTKAIALLMPLNAPRDGSNVRPGVPRLMAATGLSDRMVGIHLGRLEHMGLLTVTARGGGRGNEKATVYQLSMPAAGGLPMLLDPDGRPLRARPKRPAPAGRPRRAARFHPKPVSAQSGAVPTYETNPASGETPSAPLIEPKPASGETGPAPSLDPKPASDENDFHPKPDALSSETQDAMTRNPLRSISSGTGLNKPQSVVPTGGDLTSPSPAESALSLNARFEAALAALGRYSPAEKDRLTSAARDELRSEGVLPVLRPLLIRAAQIAAAEERAAVELLEAEADPRLDTDPADGEDAPDAPYPDDYPDPELPEYDPIDDED